MELTCAHFGCYGEFTPAYALVSYSEVSARPLCKKHTETKKVKYSDTTFKATLLAQEGSDSEADLWE